MRFAWAMPMPAAGGVARLRIPLSVGDIYGRSGLPDSDDLLHGGLNAMARMSVRCLDGTATLEGRPVSGEVEVPLNRAIHLVVQDWTVRPLAGRTADGCGISLTMTPLPQSTARMDVAVLVDRSGSMGEACGADDPHQSKHDAIRAALSRRAGDMRDGDTVDLWEFDDRVAFVGSTRKGREVSATGCVGLLSALGGGGAAPRSARRWKPFWPRQ